MSVKVPKLCHFKPRNLACVWITPTRRLYLGPWGSPESHERYAEVVRRLLLGLDVSEAPTLSSTTAAPSSTLTVRQLAERFIDFAQSYYVNDGVPTGSARVVELSVVQEIRDKLHAIRELCLTEATDLRTQLAEAEKELEQVDAALAAIGEKPSRGKTKKRSSGKSRLPFATKEEVLAVIHEVLGENGTVPGDDLKSLAGEKLRERGKSLSMFAALFAKCLDDPSLAEPSPGSFCLDGEQPTATEAKPRTVGFGG